MNADKLIAEIEARGFSIITKEGTRYFPSVAYTVGLQKKLNHPEIIVFGLTTSNMKSILEEVVDIVKTGTKLQVATCYNNFFDNASAEFLAVDKLNIKDYFLDIPGICDTENIKALQLIWTDGKNLFPWEEGFDEEFKWKQPLLDRNTSFKFREEKSLEVLVANEAIEQQKPIVHVIHEHHGKWQFLTGNVPEKMKLMTLEALIKSDPTLNETFDLEYGETAERETISGDWIKYKIEIPDSE